MKYFESPQIPGFNRDYHPYKQHFGDSGACAIPAKTIPKIEENRYIREMKESGRKSESKIYLN